MPLLFPKLPVVRKLEDLLWARAEAFIADRYLSGGESLPDDLRNWPKEARAEAKKLVNTWLSAERNLLKLAWSDYRRIVSDITDEAFTRVIRTSSVACYSVEVRDTLECPEFLAVPLEVLKLKTREAIPDGLRPRIWFEDMKEETLHSLSERAVTMSFDSVLRKAMRDYRSYTFGGWPETMFSSFLHTDQPVVLVDVLKQDFYHIEDIGGVHRLDMVIFARHDMPIGDRERRRATPQHEARDQWRRCKETLDCRPHDRRFTGEGWDLPPGFLGTVAKSAKP